MTMPSSVPGAVTTASGSVSDASPVTALGKEEAIGAYWHLYYTVVDSLCRATLGGYVPSIAMHMCLASGHLTRSYFLALAGALL